MPLRELLQEVPEVRQCVSGLGGPVIPILKQAQQYTWRTASGDTSLHRGMALMRGDMPPDLAAHLDASLDGGLTHPSLASGLLGHLSTYAAGTPHGLGEWWTPDPKSAERFAMNPDPKNYVPGGKKADYQVVVSGEGNVSSAETAMGQRYYRLNEGSQFNPKSIRVRRSHPDSWLDIPMQQPAPGTFR